ncbi:low affinity immunoglobulin epsilon Fc receptor-like [Diachasmimorpha longicaudata]|uniref:low affinity immunoglobulin epsilon Fc receptor-like n=1 Tax=Diachasmimorpha longicaudata TaxID=58733 RepID=UPI0030B8E3D7
MDVNIGGIFALLCVIFLTGDVESQFRDKNISINQEADAVQTLLARYLRRRLQATQLSTPPPPSVLFSSNQHRANVRQATRRQNDLPSTLDETEARNKKEFQREEFDDEADDLQGIEDSDRGRTRIDLLADDCPNCVDEHAGGLTAPSRWTMPLLKLGEKRYYLGIFFKANWYRASQYCRYHGMHLASIASQEENDRLEKHIKDFGLGHEHFWTSGTDQAEEGTFFWMANGRPITFENWNVGEPNNFRYENGEEEHCLELWNRDGKGLKWNDSPCSFETYFVCEVQ